MFQVNSKFASLTTSVAYGTVVEVEEDSCRSQSVL